MAGEDRSGAGGPQPREQLFIGLMSGTSADAIDAALVRIGCDLGVEFVEGVAIPIDEALRQRIHGLADRPSSVREIAALDVELGRRFADAAQALLERARVPAEAISGIGSHGQTVGHFPEPGVRASLQLGSPFVLHAQTGIPVYGQFRQADLAVGGQGAPLTPFLHHALWARDDEARAVLNIGGFTNVTFLPNARLDGIVAFDPGPGNALLDRAARWVSGGADRFDDGGGRASRGQVVAPALERLLADPYFAAAPPKSTGHEHFGEAFFELARSAVFGAGGTTSDLLATLVELTVQSVVAATKFLAGGVDRWLVYGGGVENAALYRRLRECLAPTPVEPTAAHGIPGEMVEAVAFALLGACSARGIPANVPAATGATRAVVLGARVPPSDPA